MIDIRMPQLGESVTEGTITAWRKAPGDAVEVDEFICDVTTDKVSFEVPSPEAGVMAEVLAAVGTAIPVGAVIARLAAGAPAVIRGNAAEIAVLAQRQPVAAYAAGLATVVIATGATDEVVDGRRRIGTPNGHPLMARVTAMGCAGAAIVAAFLTVTQDRLEASAAAMIALGVAGEIAAEHAAGPGSFASAYLDALYGLDAGKLATRARTA